MLSSLLERLFFELTLRTRSPLVRAWMPHYAYQFSPSQLAFLVSCIDRTRDVPGALLEVGCLRGHTTVYLNNHISEVYIEKDYFCVDTFGGFTRADVEHEVTARGKSRDHAWGCFDNNDKRWFDSTMRLNKIGRVQSFQADVNDYDFDCVRAPGVSFCLVDVDLYRPVKATLRKVYPHVASGGIIVVDDCRRAEWAFDGALAAYREFVAELGQEEQVVHDKLGVIEVR